MGLPDDRFGQTIRDPRGWEELGSQGQRAKETTVPITTIVADLDGNTVKALYCEKDCEAVVTALQDGQFVEVEDGMFVSPSSVKYVQAGKKRLPVSAAPGANARSEHQALVSPPGG
jgi:hypothetical protein